VPAISRRKFVGLSTLALTGAACSSRQGGGEAEGDLPDAIEALTSMEDLPRPITADERQARIEKARRLMRANSLDAILLAGGTSLNYFTGVQWGLSERMFAVVIPAGAGAFVVTPAFEEERAREQLAQGPLGNEAAVLPWQEDEDPYPLVATALRERGLATGTLGIEETVRFVFSNEVAAASPALRLASATPATAGCRTIKDAHELELMRLASAATLKAFEATYRSLEEGMSREDVRELIRAAHRRLGFAGDALVLVGEHTALPHGSVQPQTIREGTIILIDGGCGVEGYRSDISRTFVLGQPTDKMKQVFEVELRAQTEALRTARPGVECQAVDAAARVVIEEAGYGADYERFTHRVGHGIGMDGHEWPYLVRGNTLALAPGMTFSDEPGIYFPGEFGIRLEDDMVITEDGAELLTPQSPSLQDPFGPAPDA
jgi:Xaa-Pro aminopeptidase